MLRSLLSVSTFRGTDQYKGFSHLCVIYDFWNKKDASLIKLKCRLNITNELSALFMYSQIIPVYARFQWLNNPIVISTICRFIKPNTRGRKGYDKVWMFRWLIYKQFMGCSYRDLESMTEMDHSTFVKFRKRLIAKLLFKNIFSILSQTIAQNLDAITAIIDSSFVETYSKRDEEGSEYFGYKEKNGFKLHQMIDWETRLPILQFSTPGARSDIRWGANLIRAAPEHWNLKALTADKAYDGANFVKDIAIKFPGIKIAIPMRRHKRNDSWFNVFMKGRERTKSKKIYKKRSEIERHFSRKKGVFRLGEERTRGLTNFEANCDFVSAIQILEWLTAPQIWWALFTMLFLFQKSRRLQHLPAGRQVV